MPLEIIKPYLQKERTVFLATSYEDQPHVRAMLLIFFNDSFWSVTLKSRTKVHEIKNNPLFEFCYQIQKNSSMGSIRCRGKIEIIDDQTLKESMSKEISFFTHFFKSVDDPEYILLKYNPQVIIFHNPEDKKFSNINYPPQS